VTQQRLLSSLNQNLGGLEFKNVRWLETIVTWQQIKQGADTYEWGRENVVRRHGTYLACGWKYVRKVVGQKYN
jgi:hypothetical protein